MKALNFDYNKNTSFEVKSEIGRVMSMSVDTVCREYTLDPEDIEKFIDIMKEDYDTLVAREGAGYYINDRKEEYAQLYNFL